VPLGQTACGVIDMKVENGIPEEFPDLRLSPELRLCSLFDPVSIAVFPVADREEMGFRVLDNCCEDHIM
jgi:hypothetical protein